MQDFYKNMLVIYICNDMLAVHAEIQNPDDYLAHNKQISSMYNLFIRSY